MTEEQINIAIAEACGWSKDDIERGYTLCQFSENIPDYLNDLNAMHEAERVVLDQGLQDHWLDTLVEVVVGKNVHWSDYHCFPQVNRASAAQRAEAFLKTIGKWKEARSE